MQVEGSIAPRPTKFVYNPAMTPRRVLWIVGLIALATGVAYVWRCGIVYYPDSRSYIAPAEKLATGRGFIGENFIVAGLQVDSEGMPELFRTPGYPLLLAAFLRLHLGMGSLIAFQHLLRLVLVIGSTGFVYRISRSVTTAG